MTTYLVWGFPRGDNAAKQTVAMLVEQVELEDDPGDIAEAIAPGCCFHASENVSVPIPDDCKGVLFANEDELFARVPALRPRRVRKMRGAQ